jgi:aryl-alcohol dehydrogenase-like predicted oxidoreductase
VQTRQLGATGIEVGAIGLGCMGMTAAYTTGGMDPDAAIATIHRALDLGVTLIDTADVYGPHTNEELVARALAGRRAEAVLATKVGIVFDDADRRLDGRPEHIRASIDGSLRRLGVDYVDLYQLHRVDPAVPVEESWGALADLVELGKTRHVGLSEATAEQCARAHAIHPVASVQSELSLWTRDAIANGVLAWSRDNGAAFLAFSPLGRGFLTGALSGTTFDSTDFRSQNPRFTPQAMAANQHLVDAAGAVGERRGATPAQVAIAWTLEQGGHVVPIPGTKRVSRLEENAAAADVTLTAEDLAELDALPAPVGARY